MQNWASATQRPLEDRLHSFSLGMGRGQWTTDAFGMGERYWGTDPQLVQISIAPLTSKKRHQFNSAEELGLIFYVSWVWIKLPKKLFWGCLSEEFRHSLRQGVQTQQSPKTQCTRMPVILNQHFDFQLPTPLPPFLENNYTGSHVPCWYRFV